MQILNFGIVFYVCFLTELVYCSDEVGPIFETSLGKIKGSVLKSDEGDDFFAFRGIPFAQPPIKELRFKPPQPINKWDGILDATEDANKCIQFDFFELTYEGDEDCLYLNVYTPKFDSQTFAEPLAVMFWIHGGGFSSGSGVSSLYGAQRLIDRNVILVTINYRLGPFGFLSTMDKHSPGNYGMLDQVMALQWVQDNIHFFGGDANRVTIFGNSAGGASVTFHLLSPLSAGLFHAAIPQSGTALSDWCIPSSKEKALHLVRKIAEQLNCPISSNKDTVNCLRKRSALDLLVKSSKNAEDFLAFTPVVDKEANGANAFLPDFARNLLVNREFNQVPVVSGVTSDEGVMFLNMWRSEIMEGGKLNKEKLINLPLMVIFSKNIENGKKILEKIFEKYFQNIDLSNEIQVQTAAVHFFTASLMEYGADETNTMLADLNIPTYGYKLSYRGAQTTIEKMPHDPDFPVKELHMVSHMDELQYIFHSDYFLTNKLSDEDKVMADIILTLWTNFAKTKVPSLQGSRYNHPPLKWEAINSNNYQYLDLTLKPNMINDHISALYNAWKDFYDTLHSERDEL